MEQTKEQKISGTAVVYVFFTVIFFTLITSAAAETIQEARELAAAGNFKEASMVAAGIGNAECK